MNGDSGISMTPEFENALIGVKLLNNACLPLDIKAYSELSLYAKMKFQTDAHYKSNLARYCDNIERSHLYRNERRISDDLEKINLQLKSKQQEVKDLAKRKDDETATIKFQLEKLDAALQKADTTCTKLRLSMGNEVKAREEAMEARDVAIQAQIDADTALKSVKDSLKIVEKERDDAIQARKDVVEELEEANEKYMKDKETITNLIADNKSINEECKDFYLGLKDLQSNIDVAHFYIDRELSPDLKLLLKYAAHVRNVNPAPPTEDPEPLSVYEELLKAGHCKPLGKKDSVDDELAVTSKELE